MHPGDQANAVFGRVGFQAQLANSFRSCQHRLEDDVDRNILCMGKPLCDLLRMFGNFLERLRAVKMLASGDEPHLELLEVDYHSFLSLMMGRNLAPTRGATTFLSARIHVCRVVQNLDGSPPDFLAHKGQSISKKRPSGFVIPSLRSRASSERELWISRRTEIQSSRSG